jgi:ferredoxin-type protein NapF
MSQRISRRRFLLGDFRNRRAAPPGPSIGDACLARRGVICQVCGEQCEAGAIRFVPQSQAVPVPVLDAARCTACGTCASHCPTLAIRVSAQPEVA